MNQLPRRLRAVHLPWMRFSVSSDHRVWPSLVYRTKRQVIYSGTVHRSQSCNKKSICYWSYSRRLHRMSKITDVSLSCRIGIRAEGSSVCDANHPKTKYSLVTTTVRVRSEDGTQDDLEVPIPSGVSPLWTFLGFRKEGQDKNHEDEDRVQVSSYLGNRVDK